MLLSIDNISLTVTVLRESVISLHTHSHENTLYFHTYCFLFSRVDLQI